MNPGEIRRVLDGLDQGRITAVEADAYLRAKHGMGLGEAREQLNPAKENMLAVVVTLLMVAGIAVFAFQGGITGFLILENPGTPMPINDAFTALKVTGTMYGEGTADIWLDTAAGTLLVGNLTSDDGSPRTDRPSYAIGDPVDVENAPADASYYFDDGNSTAVDLPFPAASGELLIVTADSTYRLPIIIGDRERETRFVDLCVETCVLEPTNGTVRVETTGTARVSFSSMTADTVANAPPQLAVEFGQVLVDGNATVNLSAHFIDADGDTLYYSTGSDSHVEALVDGDLLLLVPIQEGNASIMVYANDLRDMTAAWMELVVMPADVANVTNDTVPQENTTGVDISLNESDVPDTSINITNVTGEANTTNTTGVDLNLSVNTTGLNITDCSNPDPNQRPLECIQSNESTFFKPEDLFLENRNAMPVGQLTPIGNLLIKGTWIEHSTSVPGSDDWVRGYTDEDGDFVPTAWIDTGTGDLHLRGTLTEVNGNLVFEERYTAITNKRGIILALMDYRTGDVVLRGNIIPYRRSFG